MESFIGQCVRGPWDGQHLAHTAKTKKLYRPIQAFTTVASDNAMIDTIEIGEYKLNDFGQWHWHETKSGAAADTLFGPVSA